MKWLTFFLILAGLADQCSAKLKIEGLHDSYLITDTLSCKLINDSDQTVYYFYTGETIFDGHWAEIDYTLEGTGKSARLHFLKPHEMGILEWPAWRKTRLRISEKKNYRLLVYYNFGTNPADHHSIYEKLNSREFRFIFPDHNDYPPTFIGMEKAYKLAKPIKFELVNTSKDEIEYGVGAEKYTNGRWNKVLYNLGEPFNDQKITFRYFLKGEGKKKFVWPYTVIRRDGVATYGKYRLFVEYSLTHGEDKKIHSPEFEIEK